MQPTKHSEARAELAALVEDRSVVIMGVGSQLRGDDGVGVIPPGPPHTSASS